MLPVGLCAQLACIWEATARKPGNVHRYQDFADLSYLDFLASAAAIAPVLDRAVDRPLGETVLACIRATRQVVRTNTNLGIVLLLAPLAAVDPVENLRVGLRRLLAELTVADARLTYEAIRLAVPGGLGQADSQDIRGEPTLTLRETMALAADRDLIARQYVNDFEQIFDEGVPLLLESLAPGISLERAVVQTFLTLLSRHPDSLIARKRGQHEALAVSARAADTLHSGDLISFDAWLREEGHTRNPGTTADLLAACLFVALRQGQLDPCQSFAAPF